MRFELKGTITALTGITFSYVDSPKSGSKIFLPRYAGRLHLPGNNIRGAWRHTAYEMVRLKLLESGKKLRLEDAFFITLGGVKQSGAVNYDMLSERPAIRKHLIASVFGCMEPANLRGKIQVEHAKAPADVQPDVIYGQRSDPPQRGEFERDHFSDADRFDAYLLDLTVARKSRKERENGNGAEPSEPRLITSNMPFSREVIPADTVLTHWVTLRDVTPLEVGLFLATLRHFAKDPRFGAQCGINLGVATLEYEVNVDHVRLGTLKIDGRDCTFNLDAGTFGEYETMFWTEFPKLEWKKPSKASPEQSPENDEGMTKNVGFRATLPKADNGGGRRRRAT